VGLADVTLMSPRVWHDSRGFFVETFNAIEAIASGLPGTFVQDSHSRSNAGVLRGLHYQVVKPQGKIVSVVRGRIFDVVADVRTGSPTFGKWVGVTLDDVSRQSLWIPPKFAHGFCVLEGPADVVYKFTTYYEPSGESGVIWNDSLLAIDWPCTNPILSRKDSMHRPLSVSRTDLPDYNPS
jgi:dTDP-4-dehydrorhamnose 3,5-epimerase